MKKIIIVSLGVFNGEFSQFARFLPMTAVGLHYIAAILKKTGYDVTIINQTNDKLNDKLVVQKINTLHADYVLFNQFFSIRKKVAKIIAKINYKPIIIVGGHDATFHSQILSEVELLEQYTGVDYIWQGEAENSLLIKMQSMKKEPSPKIIKNLDNRVCFLDELPILKHLDYSGDVGFLSTSRGCYKNGCSICTTPQFYPDGWKARSVKHVAREIKFLKSAGKKFVFICDDNFLGFTDKHLKRGHRIIKECQKAELKVMIMTTKESVIRAHQKQFLAEWKGTVYRCFLGIESSDLSIKSKIGKITSLNHSQNSTFAIKLLYSNGIALFAGWINFKPDSTFNELEQDASFLYNNAGECSIFTNLCQNLRIYEGTKIHKKHQHRNIIIHNGEFDYAFDIPEIGELYRFLMFHVRGNITDRLDNLLFEVTDLIYINQLQNSTFGKLYWKLKNSINQHNYNFFMRCINSYKTNTRRINKTSFIDQARSYVLQLELLKKNIIQNAKYI
jgi:radical SAM superfamily enzyme YgiQ (UPF0313 family)